MRKGEKKITLKELVKFIKTDAIYVKMYKVTDNGEEFKFIKLVDVNDIIKDKTKLSNANVQYFDADNNCRIHVTVECIF